ALDRERLDRGARRGDAVGDAARPVGLDADDDGRRDVGVGAGADQRAEGQVKVLAVLEAAVVVGQRHRAGHRAGDALADGVGEVVHRQDHDVVADPDPAVGAAVAVQAAHRDASQRALRTLWTWTSWPRPMAARVLPTRTPYSTRSAASARSVRAILW